MVSLRKTNNAYGNRTSKLNGLKWKRELGLQLNRWQLYAWELEYDKTKAFLLQTTAQIPPELSKSEPQQQKVPGGGSCCQKHSFEGVVSMSIMSFWGLFSIKTRKNNLFPVVLFKAGWMSMPLCSKAMKFQKVPGLFLATAHLLLHVFLAAASSEADIHRVSSFESWLQTKYWSGSRWGSRTFLTCPWAMYKISLNVQCLFRAPYSLLHLSVYLWICMCSLCSILLNTVCILYVINRLRMVIYFWGFMFLFYIWSVSLILTSGDAAVYIIVKYNCRTSTLTVS